MKDEWYNYSPERQKFYWEIEEMSIVEEISLLRSVIKKQNDTIRALETQSLLSIIKDRFNKWFFGTKG